MWPRSAARHGDPFAVLGPHEIPGGMAVRAFVPHAEVGARSIDDKGTVLATLERRHGTISSKGLVQGRSRPPPLQAARAKMPGGSLGVLRPLRARRHPRRRRRLPARRGHASVALCAASAPTSSRTKASTGTHFAVWAPHAERVSVVGKLQRLGRPPPRDAKAPPERDVGDLRARASAKAPSTSSRSSGRAASICRSRPTRLASPASCGRRRPRS